jgi:hypothetical protein
VNDQPEAKGEAKAADRIEVRAMKYAQGMFRERISAIIQREADERRSAGTQRAADGAT